MNLVLPPDTYSPDQLSELLLELQDLLTAIRDNSVRGKDGAEPLVLSAELTQLLAENKINTEDAPAIELLTKDIQTVLQEAPTARMLLAAAPGRPLKRQIVAWFRTEIHPLMLVTFTARSDLGGGAIVQVGSHLYDLSFRRSIIDNKSRLTEIAGV